LPINPIETSGIRDVPRQRARRKNQDNFVPKSLLQDNGTACCKQIIGTLTKNLTKKWIFF